MTMITIAMVFEMMMMMMMMMMMVVVVVVVVVMTVMDDDDNDDEDDDDDDDDDDDEVYNLITFTDLGVCFSPRPDRLRRRITPSSISSIKYSSNYTQPHSIIAKYKVHYWTKTISQWLTVHE